MILSFHPCFVAGAQIILAFRKLNTSHLELIRKADAIILPQTCSPDLYQACRNSSALLFPNYDVRFEYPGKIGQRTLLEEQELPHPETRVWYSVEKFREAFNDAENFPHRMPFLIKRDQIHGAEGVYLITDLSELESYLGKLTHLEKSGPAGFISQTLIPSEGNVLRVVILGRKAVSYWKRPVNPGQIITTVGQGAKVDKDWRADLQEKGAAAARKFSDATGVNLAAIDFVLPLTDPDPQPLFLEINYSFGRQGLGGSFRYYRLLHGAIQEWLKENGFDSESVTLV